MRRFDPGEVQLHQTIPVAEIGDQPVRIVELRRRAVFGPPGEGGLVLEIRHRNAKLPAADGDVRLVADVVQHEAVPELVNFHDRHSGRGVAPLDVGGYASHPSLPVARAARRDAEKNVDSYLQAEHRIHQMAEEGRNPGVEIRARLGDDAIARALQTQIGALNQALSRNGEVITELAQEVNGFLRQMRDQTAEIARRGGARSSAPRGGGGEADLQPVAVLRPLRPPTVSCGPPVERTVRNPCWWLRVLCRLISRARPSRLNVSCWPTPSPPSHRSW